MKSPKIKRIPKMFTMKWWKMWRSCAFPRDVVYFNYLADCLEKAKAEDPAYFFYDDPDQIRNGKPLKFYSMLLVRMSASCFYELKMETWGMDLMDKLTTTIFGKPARFINYCKPARRF